MWLDQADGFSEIFKGYLPYYLLVFFPIFIIMSPANPVAASHEFSVYRMHQYDLHTVPHGKNSILFYFSFMILKIVDFEVIFKFELLKKTLSMDSNIINLLWYWDVYLMIVFICVQIFQMLYSNEYSFFSSFFIIKPFNGCTKI